MSNTPTYRVEVDGRSMLWTLKGKATQSMLNDWVGTYINSLELGGCNDHISKRLGYVPYPTEVKLVHQRDTKKILTWNKI